MSRPIREERAMGQPVYTEQHVMIAIRRIMKAADATHLVVYDDDYADEYDLFITESVEEGMTSYRLVKKSRKVVVELTDAQFSESVGAGKDHLLLNQATELPIVEVL